MDLQRVTIHFSLTTKMPQDASQGFRKKPSLQTARIAPLFSGGYRRFDAGTGQALPEWQTPAFGCGWTFLCTNAGSFGQAGLVAVGAGGLE